MPQDAKSSDARYTNSTQELLFVGWKLAIALTKSQRYKNPTEVAKALGLPSESTGRLTFDQAMYPAPKFSAGFHDDGLIMAGTKMAESIVCSEEFGEWDQKLAKAFPEEEVLVACLHSVVDFYGYALFQGGSKIRCHAGCADDGVMVDHGVRWPTESKLYEKAQTDENGELVFLETFPSGVEAIPLASYGEEFVFELSKDFLGTRLDMGSDDLFATEMETFDWSVKGPSLWSKFRGLFR